ncbi:hypothetical protein N2152v2_000347 [Parachlorella kessleri]
MLSDLQARIAPMQQQSASSAQQDSLVISVVNSTNHMFGSFARNLAQSSSFATCARIYSLHWWAWALQLGCFVATLVALLGGRMGTWGLPLLLVTTTAVVLEMEVCNRQTGMRSFSQPNQSSWAGAVLGGFIVACVANYLFIVSAPALMRAEAQLEAHGSPLSKEIQI